MGRPKKTEDALNAQNDLTRQFASAVEAHCLTQAAASARGFHGEPTTVRAGRVCARAIEHALHIAQPTGRTWNAYRRGDRSWPLATLEQKLRLAEAAQLLSPEMASVLRRKIRLATLEERIPLVDPLLEESGRLVVQTLALAKFHQQHYGAGYALHMLQPLLDFVEQVRVEAKQQDSSMEFSYPTPTDESI